MAVSPILSPQQATRKSTSAGVLMRGQAEVPRLPQEHPGRKQGTTRSGWVLDYLVPRNKTILMCQTCNSTFAPTAKRINYQSLAQRFGLVWSNCDGCRAKHVRCHMYSHESLLGTRHGTCWDTRFL